MQQEAAYRDLGLEPVTTSVDVEPPRWWTPTRTVAQRRALGSGEKARCLRYRKAA